MIDFLPSEIQSALTFVNTNFLSEIRLKTGQPVLIEYLGEYNYLTPLGISKCESSAIVCSDADKILNKAMDGNVFSYSEQLKNGFITVKHGIRIGIAGEYVTENGNVTCIKSVTSLNIRVPHNVRGCSDYIYSRLFKSALPSVLIFSRPGLGKTTLLRDLAINIGAKRNVNVLVFDERSEISAMDGEGYGYDFGCYVDIIRCSDKFSSIKSAIRAMKPQVIITDELYGENDIKAVEYARECGICIIASTHICLHKKLKSMPFEYYINITAIGKRPIIYDKNFSSLSDCCTDDGDRDLSFG